MITVNDTHHVEKPSPSYRVRREAVDAAIAILGPLAIHEFDFVTYQRDDGRWDWNIPAEAPPLSAAVIKANGGKKFLAARQQRGTAMAIGPKLIVNAPADDLQSREAMLRDLPAPTAATCSPIPGIQAIRTAAAAAAANKALACAKEVLADDLATQAGVAFAPKRDPLDIPAFLKREATPEEMAKVRRKLAKTVGPDRPIKNPPDAKAAERRAEKRKAAEAKFEGTPAHAQRKAKEKTLAKAKADSPKHAKRTGEAKTKLAAPSSGGKTKTALVGELLAREGGCTTADILAATGWPSVSVPAQAKAVGLTLRKEKAPGEPTRYYGSKG